MISSVRSLAKRFVVIVAGEATQSAFHLALNLALAHYLAALDYGIFAIVMVMGGLSLSYVRALTGMPGSIWISQSRSEPAAAAYEVTFGSAAVLISALIGTIVGIVMHLWIGSNAYAAGLFVGVWSLRSHLRLVFLARFRQFAAVVGDGVFALTGTLMTALIILGRSPTLLDDALLSLAASNAFGILAMIITARIGVRVSFGRQVRRRYIGQHKQLGWSTLSVTMANVQGQSMAFLVAAVAGPAAYAPIAVAIVLFAPLRLLAGAILGMMQPIVAAMLAKGKVKEAWDQSLVWTGMLGLVSLVYGGAVMLVLPHLRIQSLAGSPIYLLGTLMLSIQLVALLYTMPKSYLEAMKAFRPLAIVNAISAAVGIGLVSVLLYLAPPVWSPIGGLASELVIVVLYWRLMWIAVRKTGDPKTGDDRIGQSADRRPASGNDKLAALEAEPHRVPV